MRAPAEIQAALRQHAPEVVLSIKHAAFPGEHHRPAVLAPSVRWVHVGGSGYEHMAPWAPARVTVTNSAGVLAPYLAQRVMGAIWALNDGTLRYLDHQRQRRWEALPLEPLQERTLLVVGVGQVGGRVAELARRNGLRVLGVRRGGAPHPAVHEMHPAHALGQLLPRADFVSLHVRLSHETRGLLDADGLAAMKPGACLINTARGPVVDEPALCQALASGHLGGAYLDVFEVEDQNVIHLVIEHCEGGELWDYLQEKFLPRREEEKEKL